MDRLLAMRVFTRVVETGSFARAADQLGLPRSSASKLVRDLEEHLGVLLLHRTTRRVSVTQEGQAYFPTAQRVLHELEQAETALRGRDLKPRGPLRIEVASSFANLMLIPALPDFAARYPDITLSVGISDRSVNIVGEGVDCAIRAGEADVTSFIARRLFAYQTVTFAARSYLERRGVPQTPEALEGHDIVGYFSAASGKPWPLHFARRGRQVTVERFTMAANDGTGHVNMIRAGLGIGQNLREIIAPQLASGELVTILDDWTLPEIPYALIYPSRRLVHDRLRVFIDWTVARFRAPHGPAAAPPAP
ncbi:LysR family transcriptional regulator [Pseudooceanicola sp. CBS1P-1]|uniref:LysR family transcriptional regulator n=1 Tax=Pseudooceanicola albus TaxID=2692189 RepID=A0A6L7G5N9_9RHOB|nr:MULTISPECIES: LysR family transcriptional regulator [Pseudooceanicola]MBT9386148.1 LysR family transcriptional regulator [Pseudooceanicola endophyticus]MXN19435.1 LysR family transcriptional regulator [Pseudooceanicola albus]